MAVLPSAFAQDRVDIRFKPGATSTTINGTIRGDEYIDYVLNARGGQEMVVSLAVTGTNGDGSAFFNILPAGKDYGGPYVGSTDDDRRAEITVPHDGDWAIRVYLMGNDRDTDKTVGYSIDVSIAPTAGSGAPSAPSDAGTAVQVTGGAANDVLNVRSGPGTDYQVVGALDNGSRVQKLRCERHGSSRWCEIEMMTEMQERGWVNARFLTQRAGSGANDSLQGTPEQFSRMTQPCIAQASRMTGVSPGSITIIDRIRTGGGPLLTLNAGGTKYSCRLEDDGSVTVFSEFAN
ncbi:hypothetical protein CKO40_03230 [Halochromatium glycolicum]|uniref:SH3b domain-containing protein n=2 Tax=Halochromatium glycolicum TaxID=85075 RepID=A0AAJ0U1R5_9GAMM|nr:hypothetical protein [Halochromatium glycolicum]